MKRIKAIIFDMDGVLLDAKEWHYEALNRALGHFGERIDRDEHLSAYDGLSTRRKLELLTASRGFPSLLHERVNELKQQYTMKLISAHCRPLAIHQDALSALYEEGYTLGLASNSVRPTVELAMERANLKQYFSFMLSNQDVGKPKPDPEIYLTAMNRAAAMCDQCVVVEDNHHGIEAATQAGAHVLRVAGVMDVSYRRLRSFIDRLEGPDAHRRRDRRAA
jgi:beta-phosphoglucomutase